MLVQLLKGSKSHRSVVVHYYNNFKRSEAYKVGGPSPQHKITSCG